jgi:hypothetical protein
MKIRKKLLLAGLGSLLMASGLLLAGCGDKCPENGYCYNSEFSSARRMCDKTGCAARSSKEMRQCDC